MLSTESITDPIVEKVEQGVDSVELTLTVPEDLLYLKGHFDEAPLLPGVVQIDWVMSLAKRYLQLPPRFVGMEVVKFQELILPGRTFQLSLQYKAEKKKLFFSYTSAQGRHASGRIVLE